jgi:predicted MFS family arabinose efflux permease
MIDPVHDPSAANSRRRERVSAIVASFLGLLGGQPSVLFATATTFVVPLTLSFGWGRTVPSLMYVASMVGVAIASIWIGRIIERFGAPRTVIVSAMMLSVIMALFGLQNGSVVLVVALSFLGGLLGSGTNLGVYLTILPKWFDAHLGRALGLTIVGISAGGVLVPVLATIVTATSGWRSAYFALAAMHFGITLIVAFILFCLARKETFLAQAEHRPDLSGATLADAIATPAFWILGTMIFLASMGVFGIMVHLFPLYVDRGVEQSMLPLVVVGVGMGTLLGRIVSGFMLDRIEAKAVALSVFLMGGVGISWLAFTGPGLTVLTVMGPALLIGASLGAESDIIPYMVRRVYGMLHYPVIYNRLLVPHYLGAITGTLMLGWSQDNLADPRLAVAAMGMGCFIACLLALALPSTRSVSRA